MANQLFELLKNDHQEVKQIMQTITKGSRQQREPLFVELNDELTTHMQLEEKLFYPKLQKNPDCKDLMKDALQEHQEAKNALKKLERLDADSSDWMPTFKQLQQGVLHHIQDEETKVFPKAEQALGVQECNDIARQFKQQKEATEPSKAATGKETTKRT